MIVVPGPLESEYEGPRELAVILKRPDGTELDARLVLEHVFQTPPPKEFRYACRLMGIQKSDVPFGTEIWVGGNTI